METSFPLALQGALNGEGGMYALVRVSWFFAEDGTVVAKMRANSYDLDGMFRPGKQQVLEWLCSLLGLELLVRAIREVRRDGWTAMAAITMISSLVFILGAMLWLQILFLADTLSIVPKSPLEQEGTEMTGYLSSVNLFEKLIAIDTVAGEQARGLRAPTKYM